MVSELAPLGALVSLQSLDMNTCWKVRDLAPLGALVNLQSLNISECGKVSDLAPLGALLSLQKLLLSKSDEDKVAPIQNRVDRRELLVVYLTCGGGCAL
jgi:Leucine-rich repeat (LRR) protein